MVFEIKRGLPDKTVKTNKKAVDDEGVIYRPITQILTLKINFTLA